MNRTLIKSIKKDRTLPKYIKKDLVTILKSRLYNDTYTIITMLDKSPRSMACIFRFKKLDPYRVRTKQALLDFKNELISVRNEALRCTINPYLYVRTKTTSHVRTLGDIVIPNSRQTLTINEIVKNHKYDYLDKPKMIKDYLITWNRDAKKILDDKVKNDHEYWNKTHSTKCSSKLLKLGTLLSGIAALYALIRSFKLDMSNIQNVAFVLIALVGFALVAITSSLVNSHHSRQLKKYDKQMRKLDRLYERYEDHTFDVEASTVRRVYARRMCNYPLSRINKITPIMEKYTIENYVYAEKYSAKRKYFLMRFLAFVGFVASIACAVIIFTL